MPRTPKMTRKPKPVRKPTDATMRNVRAYNRKFAETARGLEIVGTEIRAVRARMDLLERDVQQLRALGRAGKAES